MRKTEDHSKNKTVEFPTEMKKFSKQSQQKMVRQQKTKKEFKNSSDWSYNLFDNVPISLWEEDFSEVKKFVDDLRNKGITNFRNYFESNPEAVSRCVEMVKILDINKATLNLYEAKTKNELLKGLNMVFEQATYSVFKEELITLAEGNTRFESDALTKTLKGKERNVYITLVIAPGCENTWSKILLSLTDINKRKHLEKQLKSSYAYLEKLNNSLQEVIFTVRMPERVIEYTNSSIEHVFGYKLEECIDKTTTFLYPSMNEYYSFGNKLNSIIDKGDSALNTEHLFKRKTGEVFPAEVTTTFLVENNKLARVISVLRDITQRKKTQDQLRQSEARLAGAQRIAHLGNWYWNIATNELIWSDEIYRIFGLAPQQFGATYDAFIDCVHPEDRELVKQSVDEALYKSRPYSIDHRIILPDESLRFVHEEGEVTFNEAGHPTSMIGTVHDITERKQAENELRLLSHELVNMQENERRAIGRELHDEIGQSLTVLQLLLNRASRLPAEDLETSLSEAQSLITELMKKIRQLSLDLSPTILDNLGLLPTLNWYFNRFAKQTNIFVKFDHRGLQRTFAPQINITVYRIIQEALTNVARYASVNEVTINISVGKGIMDIMVEDKGKGFKTDSEDAHSSYGLSSMRERARALGGMLFIDSYPGVGTCIKAKLPLKGKYKRKKKAI